MRQTDQMMVQLCRDCGSSNEIGRGVLRKSARSLEWGVGVVRDPQSCPSAEKCSGNGVGILLPPMAAEQAHDSRKFQVKPGTQSANYLVKNFLGSKARMFAGAAPHAAIVSFQWQRDMWRRTGKSSLLHTLSTVKEAKVRPTWPLHQKRTKGTKQSPSKNSTESKQEGTKQSQSRHLQTGDAFTNGFSKLP